jgi:soluble lytic murein transglycosylase
MRIQLLVCLFLLLILPFASCAAVGEAPVLPHPGEAFYAGLLAEDPEEARAQYQTALESSSAVVKREAAKKLLPFLLEGGEIQNAEKLLTSFMELADLKTFFLTYPLEEIFPGALEKIVITDIPGLSGAETAAIAGRIAVARSSFGEGLFQLQLALEQDRSLFFTYSELLTDLGRSFQFAGAGSAGSVLFRDWESLLRTPAKAGIDLDGVDVPAIRYRLLYFAGRIERQRGHTSEAEALFTQAFALAPDPLQADASIWYILSLAFQRDPLSLIPLLSIYAPRWYDAAYFDDIMDRLSRYLAANKQWKTLETVYALLPPQSGGNARAQYAYILGRAAAEGWLDAPAEDFFRAARDETGGSFYHRALASRILAGEAEPLEFTDEPDAADTPAETTAEDTSQQDTVVFLQGFFQFGAEHFVYPYIRAAQDSLPIAELRSLAEALATAQRWDESIRLVSAYMGRHDYTLTRRDLELGHPRPFREPIETYAAETEIGPELLYGLIRTESAFVPAINSRAGAVGLTQLMPATAVEIAGTIRRRGGPNYAESGEIDLHDPETNVHLGAAYLRYLLDRQEGTLLALLDYNGGMGRIRRLRAAEPQLPADLFMETIDVTETRSYGRKVLAAAAVYGYLYYELPMEAVVADIYK